MSGQSQQEPYLVQYGRANVYYTEQGWRMRLSTSHEEGPGRGTLHIVVKEKLEWYRPADPAERKTTSGAERYRKTLGSENIGVVSCHLDK